MSEARKSKEQSEGKLISDSTTTVATNTPGSIFTAEELEKAKSFDIALLYGTWPGDEPIEELLAELKSSKSSK